MTTPAQIGAAFMAEYAAKRCPAHNTLLDEHGHCDLCSLDCLTCSGAGVITTTHPQWGSRTCPEDIVEERCGDCDGTGERP